MFYLHLSASSNAISASITPAPCVLDSHNFLGVDVLCFFPLTIPQLLPKGFDRERGKAEDALGAAKSSFALSMSGYDNIRSFKIFARGFKGSCRAEHKTQNCWIRMLLWAAFMFRRIGLFSVKGTSSRYRASSFIMSNAVSEK